MRNRIILATVEEINLHGFKFTMSDLTKRLSISKSSLYEHFSSKDELIGTILTMILDDLLSQEESIYQSNLPIIEKLQAALTIQPKIFEPFYTHVYDALRTAYPSKWQQLADYRRERMDRLLNLLTQGMENGTIRRIHLGVLQRMIISSMNDLVSYHFLAENNMTFTDATTAMLDIIINGIQNKTTV